MRSATPFLPAAIGLVVKSAKAVPQVSIGPSIASSVSSILTVYSSTTGQTTGTATQPTGTVAPGSIFLGNQCNSSDVSPCAYGAQCYGVTAMTIPTCGSFQASCNSNAQCATNTCENGFCGGFATNGTGALGDACSPTLPGQCANGANCYATNSGLIPRCGNFQASCSSDSQCAYNTCNNGLCNGFLSSTTVSMSISATSPTSITNLIPLPSFTDARSTSSATATPTGNISTNSTPTGTLPPFSQGAPNRYVPMVGVSLTVGIAAVLFTL